MSEDNNNPHLIKKGEEKYLRYLMNKRVQKACQEVAGKIISVNNFSSLAHKAESGHQQHFLKYKIKQVF